MMRCVKCRGRQHLRQKILSGTWQIAVQPLREVRALPRSRKDGLLKLQNSTAGVNTYSNLIPSGSRKKTA